MEIRNGRPTVAVAFPLKNLYGVSDVGASADRVMPLVVLLADEGLLVEFTDINEKNSLRTASAFDIGEQSFLLHANFFSSNLSCATFFLVTFPATIINEQFI